MPYRAFCDRCEKETPENYVSNRAIIKHGDWLLEIMVAQSGCYNRGILCRECLFHIIQEGRVESSFQKYHAEK